MAVTWRKLAFDDHTHTKSDITDYDAIQLHTSEGGIEYFALTRGGTTTYFYPSDPGPGLKVSASTPA